ncbi:MAG: (d)CMP kinase [Bacillota bacterium]|nr:(d)CMP kinase [Bacillota bacterium]
MEKNTIQAIAIDGPSGAGKSTVAKELARRLGFKYIDTGAMYRAVTLKVLLNAVDPCDEAMATALAATAEIELANDFRVYLDGDDVTKEIRGTKVTNNVSQVCSYAGVRENLVDKQRKMAEGSCVVMDGRDIGTKVLPNAALKIFLTASPEERGRRRYEEWRAKGIAKMSLDEVVADLRRRDYLDSTREHDPLRRAEDAVWVDSDGLTVDEVVEKIVVLWGERQ